MWQASLGRRTLAYLVLVLGLAALGWGQTTTITPPMPQREAPLMSLAPLLALPQPWEATGASLQKLLPNAGFAWVSAEKNSARSAYPNATLLGNKVWETLLRFEDQKVAEMSFSFYNRGDAGDWDLPAFDRLVAKLGEQVATHSGDRGKNLDNFGTAGLDKKARLFIKAPIAYQLEWLAAKGGDSRVARPEYLRLRLFPTDAQGNVSLVKKGPRKLSSIELMRNVKKSDNGQVVIEGIPMVDQGNKGYCAVAVTERVLRYYGREVDQHEIAQLSGADAEQGTDPESLRKAMQKVASKLGVSVKTHQDFDLGELKSIVRNYNTVAKRKKEPEIELPKQGVIDVMYLYHVMDLATLKEGKGRGTARDGFMRSIQEKVDKGVPLLWSVVLGKVQEGRMPQMIGGHMRLIIGYNEKAEQIFYTDTWGAGHELKRMALDDAWAITLMLSSMETR